MKKYKLKVGDKAHKCVGSYSATGLIVARFLALDGSPRYVFQFDNPAGLLHIFGESQLRRIE